LGLDEFARLYVTGFLNGGSYEKIPIEIHAYGLQGRVEANPSQAFSVEDDVAEKIAKGQL
jgi:hypothetical protein